MRNFNKGYFLGLLVCGAMTLNGLAQAEVVVIANPDNSASEVSAKNAGRIFLGKTKSLPGGGKVTPVDQAEGNANRAAFYKGATGKSESQLKSYWSKRIFTGKGTPPDAVGDDAAVKAWVASNPDGIGYVDKSVADDSVKILLSVP